jgi:hypothetical protein
MPSPAKRDRTPLPATPNSARARAKPAMSQLPPPFCPTPWFVPTWSFSVTRKEYSRRNGDSISHLGYGTCTIRKLDPAGLTPGRGRRENRDLREGRRARR